MIKSTLLKRLVEDELEAGNGDKSPLALAERLAYSAVMEKYGPTMVEVSDPSALGRELLGHERDSDQVYDLIINQRHRFPSFGEAARTIYPNDSLMVACADFWDAVDEAEDELRQSKCATVSELLQ